MTAPLFHLEPGALAGASAGAEVVFDGAEARHAAAAMRLAPGEAVLLADGSGTRNSMRLAFGLLPVIGIRTHAERLRAEYTRFTGAS